MKAPLLLVAALLICTAIAVVARAGLSLPAHAADTPPVASTHR